MTTNKVSSESPFYFQLIHVNNIWSIKTVFMQNGYRLQWYGILPPFLIRYLAQLGLLFENKYCKHYVPTGVFYLFRTNQVCNQWQTKLQNIDKHINIQNVVVLEEDTVWKCVSTWFTSTITVGKR